VNANANQKSQAIERWSMNSPESSRPAPPPIPKVVEIIAIADATRSGGSSSRTMPNASGKIAPPAPCTTRPMMRKTMLPGASAQISEPIAKTISELSRTRSLPTMSPSRPSTGVATLLESRNAVSSQTAVVAETPVSCWIGPMTGITIVCASA
jgi:hypothetical protein